jgi:signal transduction histidine kinase
MQVALNLLSNAVKFSPPEGGEVRVRMAPAEGAVEVAVSDNGPGIAAEDQRLIFEKFRQVSSGLKDKPAGSGLGLALCRRIVEHLGGRIWVESRAGQGSTFKFQVPTVVPAEQAVS